MSVTIRRRPLANEGMVVSIKFDTDSGTFSVLVDDEPYQQELSHADALALRASLRSEWTLLKHEEDV